MKASAGIDDFSVDFTNHILKLTCKHKDSPSLALAEFTKADPADLRIVSWNAREVKALETSVKDSSVLNLRELKRSIPNKHFGDIVRAYYQYKGKKYGAIWEAKRQGESKAADELTRPDQAHRAVSPAASIIPSGPSTAGMLTCTSCHTNKSPTWYRGNPNWPNPIMCIDCGLYWRKYATELTGVESLEFKRLAQHEDSPAPSTSRSRGGHAREQAESRATPAPVIAQRPDPTKCVFCRRMDPKKKLIACMQCSMSVHQGCYSFSDEDLKDQTWLCDACANEQKLESNLHQDCVLCPLPKAESLEFTDRPASAAPLRARKGGKGDANGDSAPTLSALEVMKQTEGHNWAHVICAAYIPEIVYSDPSRLSKVEGAGTLPMWRYHSECEICHEHKGACVLCAEPGCRRTFHVSCAYANQPFYHFGFEIKPVKSVRREATATVSFKAETGHMKALVWCQDHRDGARSKTLYDLSEVDPASGLTALQAFAMTHKHVAANNNTQVALQTAGKAYGLLRRAMRYDTMVASVRDGSAREGSVAGHSEFGSSAADEETKRRARRCCKCATPYTPYWWEVPDEADAEAKEGEEEKPSPSKRPRRTTRYCCNQCRPDVLADEQQQQDQPMEL